MVWDRIIEEHLSHPLKPEMAELLSGGNSTPATLFSIKKKFEDEGLEMLQ